MASISRSLCVARGLVRTAQPLRKAVAGPSRVSAVWAYRFNSTLQPPPSPSSSAGSSSSASSASSDSVPALEAPAPGAKSVPFAKVEPRLSMTFTCTADDCGHRSTHEFWKKSYEKGIVLVQCPSCKNRHLIADHLGWFNESTEEGKLRTVEDLLRAKGETIKKGRVNFDGDIEYTGEQ